ncbi:extracellular solute-binding protein [Marinobacteraceae bacterium S3BR75-40.1]
MRKKGTIARCLFLLGFSLLATLAFPGQAAETAVAPRHAVAMYGAPKYPADFKHFDYVKPDAPKGGTLRQAVVASGFDTFNPFTIKGVSAAGTSNYLYDTLTVQSEDEPFTEYGLIAESIEMPDDRSWVVFNLNPKARFHDGEPIQADDVVFSFNTLVEKGNPAYAQYYADVANVKAINKHRVRFEFKNKTNRELPLILGQLPVLPKHYWKDRDFNSVTLEPPVGSGPYRIADFEAGNYVEYKRVDDYWGKDLPVNRGRFNFDRLRFEYYSDDTVALEAFKAGNYDFRLETTAKVWATAYEGDKFDEGLIVKEEIEHDMPAGMQGFIYNTRRDIFSDPLVRQALAYAFDFAWTNKNLFYGQYTRTDSYFENSELESQGLPSKRELEILEPYRDQLKPEVFNKEYEPPKSDGSGNIRDNLRQAYQLLQKAGYTVKDGKMVNKETGKPLKFQILLHQKAFERVVLPFAKNLEKLGIDAEVRLIDTNQYVQRIRSFNFDMTVLSLPQSRSPGNEQRSYWTSEAAKTPGSRNYMGVSDPVVDELVAKVIASPNRETLVARTRALDRVLLWGHYVIPQWYLAMHRVAYWNKLHHPQVIPDSGVALDTWWIEPSQGTQ